VLEPETPFVDGFHVHAVCDHPQALTEGRIRHLIINVHQAMPNRCSRLFLACVGVDCGE
jgi:hypothetical protein